MSRCAEHEAIRHSEAMCLVCEIKSLRGRLVELQKQAEQIRENWCNVVRMNLSAEKVVEGIRNLVKRERVGTDVVDILAAYDKRKGK